MARLVALILSNFLISCSALQCLHCVGQAGDCWETDKIVNCSSQEIFCKFTLDKMSEKITQKCATLDECSAVPSTPAPSEVKHVVKECCRENLCNCRGWQCFVYTESKKYGNTVDYLPDYVYDYLDEDSSYYYAEHAAIPVAVSESTTDSLDSSGIGSNISILILLLPLFAAY